MKKKEVTTVNFSDVLADEIEKNKNDETVPLVLDILEKDLLSENEKLRKENIDLKKQIEKYREMEVELSTEIDMLRLGIIK